MQAMRASSVAIRPVIPGILLAATLAMAARFISGQYGGPTMLYALLFGMAFNFLSEEPKTTPGVEFSVKTVLRVGVALLGIRITIADVAALGWTTVAMIVSAVAATLVVGWGLGRLFRLNNDHAVLSAGAVAICGASAALAIAAVLPPRRNRELNTLLTVVGVTTLSTMSMIFYPIIAQSLSFDEHTAGVFFGATIHDVAQVMGAGHIVSDAAGETATLVKLMRVAMLVPVSLAIAWAFRERGGVAVRNRVPLPWFLSAFVLCVLLNSAGIVPSPVVVGVSGLSSWCIVMAVSALGVRTSMRQLVEVGPRPLAAMVVQTVFLAIFVGTWLLWAR